MICERLGYKSDQLADLWKALIPFESLEAILSSRGDDEIRMYPVFERDPLPLEESAVERIDYAVMQEVVAGALSTITPREEMVVKLRYGLEDGEEHTLEEVGQVFKVTRERIRQIEKKAIRKLRHPSRSRKLKVFWCDIIPINAKEKNHTPEVKAASDSDSSKEQSYEQEERPDETAKLEEKNNPPVIPDTGEEKKEIEGQALEEVQPGRDLGIVNATMFSAWLKEEGINKAASKAILAAVNKADAFAYVHGIPAACLYGVKSLKDARMAIYAMNANHEFEIQEKAAAINLRKFGVHYMNFVKRMLSKNPLVLGKQTRVNVSCEAPRNDIKPGGGSSQGNPNIHSVAQNPSAKREGSLLAAVLDEGLSYLDNRAKGGCLWVFGGSEITQKIQKIEKKANVGFRFKKDGPAHTNRPAWWTKGLPVRGSGIDSTAFVLPEYERRKKNT